MLINQEILEEIIYERLIEKDKLLDLNLYNEKDFCFYCNKLLKEEKKCYFKTLAGEVVVCKDCKEKKEIEERIKKESKVWQK